MFLTDLFKMMVIEWEHRVPEVAQGQGAQTCIVSKLV